MLVLLLVPVAVSAVAPDITFDENTIKGWVERASNWLFTILLAVVVIVILWGAFTLVIAGGDSSKVSSGKNFIVWALVGLIVAILAKGIVGLVRGWF